MTWLCVRFALLPAVPLILLLCPFGFQLSVCINAVYHPCLVLDYWQLAVWQSAATLTRQQRPGWLNRADESQTLHASSAKIVLLP